MAGSEAVVLAGAKEAVLEAGRLKAWVGRRLLRAQPPLGKSLKILRICM